MFAQPFLRACNLPFALAFVTLLFFLPPTRTAPADLFAATPRRVCTRRGSSIPTMRCAAGFTGDGSTATVSPTAGNILTKASRLNLSIFPFTRSDTRGCCTPKTRAAWTWVHPFSAIFCSIAIINRLRADRFAASSGVSAISLKTLSAIPRLLVPLLGYINVRLRGLLRLLREHVQHMDFAAKLRYIHQPSDASVVSGPYLN